MRIEEDPDEAAAVWPLIFAQTTELPQDSSLRIEQSPALTNDEKTTWKEGGGISESTDESKSAGVTLTHKC